jgi:hypothetical protein
MKKDETWATQCSSELETKPEIPTPKENRFLHDSDQLQEISQFTHG